MAKYVFRRLWTSLPVVILITAITFLFVNLAPGDPVDAMIDPQDRENPKS